MIINNCSLDKLRKCYDDDKKFIIRIRQQDKETNKKDCKDIVYCEGIKAFYVENKECCDNNVTITIPENIYKINQTNIRKIIDSLEDTKDGTVVVIGDTKFDLKKELNEYFKCNPMENEDDLREKLDLYLNKIENNIDNFVKNKNDLKQKLETYFEVKLKKEGKFCFGEVFFKGSTRPKIKAEEIKKQVEIRLRLLNERLIKLGTSFDVDNTIGKLKTIKKHKNGKKDKIVFELQNIEKLSSFELTKIEALMILYTTFTLKFEKSKPILKKSSYSGLAKPDLDYDTNSKTIKYAQLEEFNKNIEDAISNYEKITKVELEKKYQHSFMTKNKLSYYSGLSSVDPFEEEYYTRESDNDLRDDDASDKRGRIDCIFVDTNENKKDIYLIELKVNEGVIGKKNDLSEHGINTHLDDINKLINNEGKLNLTKFLENIENRYNYRNEKLGKLSRISDINEYNLHYWIICAIQGEEQTHAQKVWDKIKNLKDDDVIKANESFKSLLETGEACLKSKDGNINCDLKLLFDVWKDDEKTEFLEINEFEDRYIKTKS